MTAPDAPDWSSYSHQQIYDMTTSGLAALAAQAAEDNWVTTRVAITVIEQRLSEGMAALGAGWEGVAADAAAAGITPLGRWALEAVDRAEATSTALNTQGEYALHTMRHMPPPRHADLPAAPPDPATARFLDVVEWQEADRQRTNDEARARELMQVYQANSEANTPALAPWIPPPQVVLEPAAAGGGGAGGAGAAGPGTLGAGPGGAAVAGAGTGVPAAGGTGVGVGSAAGAPGVGGVGSGPGAVGPGAIGPGASGPGAIGPGAIGPVGPGAVTAAGSSGTGTGGPGRTGLPGAATGTGGTGGAAGAVGAAPGRAPGSTGPSGSLAGGRAPGAPTLGGGATGRGPGAGMPGGRAPGALPGEPGRTGTGAGGAPRLFAPPATPSPPTTWRDLVRTTPGPEGTGGRPGTGAAPEGTGAPRSTPAGEAARTAAQRAPSGIGHPGLYPPMAGAGAGASGQERPRPPWLVDDSGVFDVEPYHVPPVLRPADHPSER